MRRLTKEEFIKKSNLIYDGLYNYSDVLYVNNKTEVNIYCNNCNSYFKQKPNAHLERKKINCKCSNKLTTEKFIERSIILHNNLFNYKNVNYIDSYTKVEIICNNCNSSFWQKPHNHLNGNKCPNCFGTHKKTTEEFIRESKKVHKERYDYSNVIYKNNSSKVKIICKSCKNEFCQIPTDHINGSGCPSCCGGFNPHLPAILYYIKVEKENRNFYKVGITNRTVSKRFSGEMCHITVIKTKIYKKGIDAYNDEKEILERFKEYKYSGIPVIKSGNTELFTIDILNLDK